MMRPFDPDRLARAVFVRGLQQSDLARLAKLSEPTVSAALRGRRVTSGTALALSRVLGAMPPIPELEVLISQGIVRTEDRANHNLRGGTLCP